MTKGAKRITCGGLGGGKTDMSQFQNGFVGFYEVCMKNVPKCLCSDKSSRKASCCSRGIGGSPNIGNIDPTKQEVGAQFFATDGPETEEINSTKYPEKKQFGIPIGHQYGFCFVPYPSFLPGNGSSSSWTRCMPDFGGSTDNFNSSIGAISSSLNRSSSVDSSILEQSAKSVVASMSGPRESAMALIDQMRQYKWVIAGSAGIALAISILYTFLLKVAAGPLIFTIMASIWILLTGVMAILCVKASFIDPGAIPGSTGIAEKMPDGITFGPAQANKNLVVGGTIVVGILWVLYNFLLCVMIPRISVALKVMNIASSCLASIPTVLVMPILTWILTVALYVYFVVILWYLASAGTWDAEARRYVWNSELQRLMLVHFFGTLWGHAFILAMGNLVVAGATAEWFLADDKKFLSMPALSSLHRTVRYHIGTAAVGSFLIAVVQMIRWAFRYYMYQLNKMNPDGTFGSFVKILSCIGECCLDCLERFLDFINKNAYIQTAIKATSFIPSTIAAGQLILRNILRIGTLNIVTSMFVFLGKYFIALATGAIAALWISALESSGSIGSGLENISSAPVFPIIVIVALAFGE